MRRLCHWIALLLLLQRSGALAVSSEKPLSFFIGGLGYCGSRLALRLRQEFPSCSVAGCVRSNSRKQRIEADSTFGNASIRVHVLDLDENYNGLDEAGIADLSQATHVVQTIAPIADFDQDPFLALHKIALEESQSLEWVGFLSSTGVYGDYDGEWVDETSELRCQDAKSLARVKAEEEWRQLEERRRQNGLLTRVDCFRCGGIYGSGRGPLFSASLSSPSVEQEGATRIKPKYVNRILVDDICGAIVAAVRSNVDKNEVGKIYNLADDDPAPRRDVVAEARRLVGSATEEKSSTAESSVPQGRRRPTSRNTGNKRVRNQRLKDDYNWKPSAPTFREGLAILLQEQNLRL